MADDPASRGSGRGGRRDRRGGADRRARRQWFQRPLYRDPAFLFTAIFSAVVVAAEVTALWPSGSSPLAWVGIAFYAAFTCILIALLVSLPVRMIRAWYGSHQEAEAAAQRRGGATTTEKAARLGGRAVGSALAKKRSAPSTTVHADAAPEPVPEREPAPSASEPVPTPDEDEEVEPAPTASPPTPAPAPPAPAAPNRLHALARASGRAYGAFRASQRDDAPKG